jgi:hypothetical protein
VTCGVCGSRCQGRRCAACKKRQQAEARCPGHDARTDARASQGRLSDHDPDPDPDPDPDTGGWDVSQRSLTGGRPTGQTTLSGGISRDANNDRDGGTDEGGQ